MQKLKDRKEALKGGKKKENQSKAQKKYDEHLEIVKKMKKSVPNLRNEERELENKRIELNNIVEELESEQRKLE
eukprot:3934696-Rhodomonas_salina.1